MQRKLFCLFIFMRCASFTLAQESFVAFQKTKEAFPLFTAGVVASLVVSDEDFDGVKRAVSDLQKDIEMVTAHKPEISSTGNNEKNVVMVGTLGRSKLIDRLVVQKKIDVSDVSGRWESFFIQVVENPMKGVERALVIVGSDKRGTIYGIYEVSRQIGVSPWYWWADVKPRKSENLFVKKGRYKEGEPSVKYRGIFLNDEEPALGRWAVEKFGGFNHQFYEKVFELILRLKGNYLWPAMWWASFNSDDPLNPALADQYGVVMGTTHHEPMNRAHAEWKSFDGGAWDYERNPEKLRAFWTAGIERMRNYETIVSLAMRGDGDKAMNDDTNISLLQQIVKDQRDIIHRVTGKNISETPQLWALYKEVQDYYDKGMRVPDDVMLLLCDDNWGNLRKLPKLTDAPRTGGYGIYYHFDYVGGPRNYKWLNTSPIARVWEQMNLAYQYGATRIWIVNVGDLKPMEFPISFFMDYAWNAKAFDENTLDDYSRQWVIEQFGTAHAPAIANLLAQYTKFNGRRKPELLSPTTYSLIHYREAERVVNEYCELAKEAERIYKLIAPPLKDAYYQLILHPIQACANLNALYLTVGKNRLYALQGRASTNDLADSAKALFDNDAAFSTYYNKALAAGKWNNMMNQTHISYTSWQQPEKDVLPEVKNLGLADRAEMGVAIEGSSSWWPFENTEAILPEFDRDNQQQYYFEIFNRGTKKFNYLIKSDVPWILLSRNKGIIEKEQRVEVKIDWNIIPAGKKTGKITIEGPGGVSVDVNVVADSDGISGRAGFVERNGYISIEAHHFHQAVNTSQGKWVVLPDHGRTASGVTVFPVTQPSSELNESTPFLIYRICLADTDTISIQAIVSPTIDFHNNGGLRYAISIDDEIPKVINIHQGNSLQAWEKSVRDNAIISVSSHPIKQNGNHTLKFWRIDPGVVLQKIIIDGGGLKPSYLGPPESHRIDDKP